MIQVFLLSSRRRELLLTSIQLTVSIGGRLSPHHFEMFSISPQQAWASCCWFSNNSARFFFARMLSKLTCGKSCHLYPNDLTSILSLRRHCDVVLFTHHLVLWGSCSFHAYPFNRSVVSSLQVIFILSSFPSSFSQSAAQMISILFLLYLVLTGVVSISILSQNLLVLVVSLVPLF